MADVLFHYEKVNPSSWAYLSSLLMIALYFKFNRIWSVRNFDLFLLISLAPGLLLVQYSWENVGLVENVASIERAGFLWLFVSGGLLLVRLLLDSAMVRRPLLEPNLNAGGLICLGGSLLFFLMANVVTGDPKPSDLSPAREASTDDPDAPQASTFATDGPGFWLLYRLPRIATQKVIDAGATQNVESGDMHEQRVRAATTRIMAILSHTMIVLGLLLVGYRHFGNVTAGIASATMYLMLPYTALWTGSVDHAVPASLLVWAVVLYRYPLFSGLLIGLVACTNYYPLFLIPLWCSYYWLRGVKRFTTGVLLAIGAVVISMAVTSTSMDGFLQHLVKMFGLQLPVTENLQGIWQYWPRVYRYPVLAAFVGLSISFAVWPTEKNLGTLISGSAALMLGAQFWHAYGGGIYIAWYLPLLLLTIFRPNLQDSTALRKVGEGWWNVRRRRLSATP